MLNVRNRLIYVILFTFPWLGTGVRAQSPGMNRLTLPQALDLARTNFPGLQAKLAQIRAAEADRQEVRASLLPQAGIQAQALNATSNQVRGASVSSGWLTPSLSGSIKPNGFTAQPAWTSFVSSFINWEVVTFGRNEALRDQARTALEQQESDYERELFVHQFRVCDAYLQALNARKELDLQQANLSRVEAIQRITRAGTDAGLKPGMDSAIVAAEVFRARTQMLESDRNARQQLVRLTELIGQPTTLVELDTVAFYSRLPDSPPVAVDAPALHPTLRWFKKQIDWSEATEKVIRASTMPSVSVLGGLWGRGSGIRESPEPDGSFRINSSPGAGLPLRAFNYLVGVTAVWQPTDLNRAKYAITAQRERTRAFQAVYEQEALALRAGDQNARLQWDMAQQVARQTPRQLAVARQAYAQAQSRYNAGLDNIMTLTQVVSLLNRSEADQVLAVTGLWRALLLRAATSGDLGLFTRAIAP
ncbi:hypothetical protein GCM10023189_23740 [Nibrella saemangeumensis]|uniref:TolC family protein n=1 Tax=Nibrella saemangeumensis TaxID=1084526 RepID=A0ABP8MVI9_9BACT